MTLGKSKTPTIESFGKIAGQKTKTTKMQFLSTVLTDFPCFNYQNAVFIYHLRDFNYHLAVLYTV
tara:strand:+ start:834 stop:1028 length:195 start_codon:yes stop_codon:yes gene_type:complete